MNTSKSNRRQFLKTGGLMGLAAGLSISTLPSWAMADKPSESDFYGDDDDIGYDQKPLPYAYAALEPVVDAMTMEIHYTKHAAGYAKNLVDATTAEGVDRSKTTVSGLLRNISKYSAKMRNNAGGHYNHELFWKTMKAPGSGGAPSGDLLKAIERSFNSVEAFKTQFSDAAKNRFGSGWAWLVMTSDKTLAIGSTPNQDNPLMDISDLKGYPVLGLDVWEHAYYLKYQNRRPDYVTAWWNAVNWEVVNKRFNKRD